MHKHNDGKVFAPQQSDAATPTDAGTTPGAPRPHARRHISDAEQRLRAANQQSWMSTRSGWTRLFRRFMPGRSR
jgi:hypothetical protein